ncbi:MAG: hypothetical protein DMF62_17900 [Acidobacteria bacterium]|nr:MAG: hypothetical protein DMF62_17900 [Acidobacteriota bacterium]
MDPGRYRHAERRRDDNADSNNAVYISAVCGHNSNVVNNNGVPEQLLFNQRSNSVVLMTLSDQKNALAFDAAGDLRETTDKCADASGRVLNDAQARSLASTAERIQSVFGKKPQDIEWGILAGKIYIVQSRPYLSQ